VSNNYEEKYTKPKLREKLKESIKAGDKGGRPGQWSARKAQMLVKEYEKQGGGYRREKDARQKSLEKWTAEEWQTVEGKADADQSDAMHRYLPGKAWSMLSARETRKAEKSKIKTDDEGRQYADWPDCVVDAMTLLGRTGRNAEDVTKQRLASFASELEIKGRSKMNKSELIKAIQSA